MKLWTGNYKWCNNWYYIPRTNSLNKNYYSMNKLVRGLIAGYGAKKLGGGCLGTIIVFIIIYALLGNVHC